MYTTVDYLSSGFGRSSIKLVKAIEIDDNTQFPPAPATGQIIVIAKNKKTSFAIVMCYTVAYKHDNHLDTLSGMCYTIAKLMSDPTAPTAPTAHTAHTCTPFTPQRRAQVVDLLAQGYNLSSAARAVGIHPRTAYLHQANDPDFARAVAEAREIGIDRMEDAMREKALAPQGFLPNIAWLKAHRREKWGDKLETTSHSTLRIVIGPAPSVGELEAADAQFLPNPALLGGQDVRHDAVEATYHEIHDSDGST